MADNAWRYSGAIVLSKSALHSLTRRRHSATVSSGMDEVVIRASVVSMYYRQFRAFTAIAIPIIVARGITSLISFYLRALGGAKEFRRASVMHSRSPSRRETQVQLIIFPGA